MAHTTEVTWGLNTVTGRLEFQAVTEVDGKPYSYSKDFPLSRMRFAQDRAAEVQAMARETTREMAADLAQLKATFEARGSDKKPGGGSYHE